jgi:predicted ATPase/DNA-binding winged helix-turn-helix (wHTH) protein
VATSYRFGTVEVRPGERQLLVEGRPAAVGARAFDLLLALIEQRDRVVSKDELLERVWPGLIVEENNLQVQVSTLRKVLGAQAVSTIPGRGYRFTLEPDESPAPAPKPRRHNLPAQLNRFIGRDRDLELVTTLLEPARMLTLTGAGGTGKTRLTLQYARVNADLFPDGVWLVELAPIADAARVPQAAAFALGVAEEPGRPMVETLERYVAERRMLLVLDNCEHVLGAAADLAKRLLAAGPEVKILASSREPLHVSGEMTYAVPTLDAQEAMRLFVDRAHAAQPAFEVSAPDEHMVAEICRRLDGIPLAIELAAARVRALSVANIAERLDDRFRLLVRGDHTALPRQQTLRASIDWSHDLLSPGERTVFRRLAVFVGGFTLEAAEAVAVGGEVAGEQVLELLTHLVEKSLVETDARVERYRLLETVRQYALERLDEAAEADVVRQRHLQFHLALAQEAHPHLRGPEQGKWLARLDHERENVLAAHAYCDYADNGAELGLRLVASIKIYWASRGLLPLAHRVMLEALARAQERSRERSRVLFDVGQIDCFLGRYADARAYLEECLAIARERGDEQQVAAVLQPLGMACLGLGDRIGARLHSEEGLALARGQDDRRNLAAALVALAQLERVEKRAQAAEPLYLEALEIARALGDRGTVAIALLNLAMVCIDRGQGDRGRLMLSEAMDIADASRSRPLWQSALEVCAGLSAWAGAWRAAAWCYGAAQAEAEASGIRRDPVDEAFLAPWIAKATAGLGAETFAQEERAGRELAFEDALARARAELRNPSS